MVSTVVERLGRLDIAVNNAGMNRNHAAEECSEEDWDLTFQLNTKGVFLCAQARLAAAFPPDEAFSTEQRSLKSAFGTEISTFALYLISRGFLHTSSIACKI